VAWPATAAARDQWVTGLRSSRPRYDPVRYLDLIVEDERTADGSIARVATVFLTGRECPWRCVMCDLWTHTTASDTPAGAIPAQLASARTAIAAAGSHVTDIKLYNAGSFFDPRAVPEADYDDIGARLDGFERVVVESHPALVGPRVDRFLDALQRCGSADASPPALEVALGLETAHPVALERLNKRMTTMEFAAAADRLRVSGVALRVFLLIAPPFIVRDEQDEWLLTSIDVALTSGATAVSLIPTRPGNGAVEALAAEGLFNAPRLADVERSFDAGLQLAAGRARLFVDLWDLPRLKDCAQCFDARRTRLHAMNLEQRISAAVICGCCGARSGS
jgi:radical SAM enzyme (TIGR01210 family)